MAKVRLGGGVAQASGRLGGLVFSHNRGGAYVRARSVPVQPRTSYQLEIRSYLSQASISWDLLADAAKAAWASWAESTPVMNTLGDSIRLQGNAAYVQLNSRLLLMGESQAGTPPSIVAPRPLNSMTFTADIGAGTTQVDFTETPLGTDDMLFIRGCYLPRPGVQYVKNKLRFVGVSAAAQATAYDYKAQVEARLGPMVVGQILELWISVVSSANGQISPPMRYQATITTTP